MDVVDCLMVPTSRLQGMATIVPTDLDVAHRLCLDCSVGSDDVLPLHPGCYPASTPLAYSCDMDDRG